MKDGFYRNYPEEFYLINDLVPHIYKDIDLDPRKADIFITTFDYLNRCVNYYALIPERKQFYENVETKNEKLSTNIRKYLMNPKHIESWNSYLDKYFKHERFRDTKEFFKKKLQSCGDHELHYHFAKLYHFFPINSEKYIDGVLRKVLSEKNEFGYVEIEEAEWPDIKLCLYDTNRKEIRIRWDNKKYDNPQIINQLELTIVEQPLKENAKANTSLDPKLFWEYFLSAMVKDDFTGKECVWPFKKGIHNSHVVIPIFDGGLPYEHKGNILSFIDLRFKSKNGAKDYLKLDKNQQPIEEIRNKWGPHIAEIAFDARRYELISQNIKHAGDILKDLLWKVAFIQDWERIMVFSKSSDQEPQFCFKRFPGDQVGRLEYEKVWGVCEREDKCKGCEDLLNDLKKTLYKNEKVHKNGNNFIFFQKMDDFLDPKVLPSIEDADITRYKNHILCFEFPQYAFFPTESNTEQDKKKVAIEKLGEHYINKLIPIFDQLLLKKKVLKHSIKSAVAAIMSRNMSHNIGSHILARIEYDEVSQNVKKNLVNSFKAEIAKQIKKNNNGMLQNTIDKNAECKIDKYKQEIERTIPKICGKLIGDFHKYIQKKNDFLAEVSTEPYRSPRTALFYRDVILPFTENILLLDYIASNEGMTYGKVSINVFSKSKETGCCCEIKVTQYQSNECKDKDHLIKFKKMPFHKICPICMFEHKGGFEETLYARYSIQNAEYDVKIDIPGSVGEFAVYNIIEAIIRNATKHNVTEINKSTTLDVNILIEDDPEEHSMYLFTIWDNLSDENKVELMNDKIKKEIVDQSTGKLNPQNWGIGEMKICAALLQGRSFDEIISFPEKFLKTIPIDGKLGYQFKILKARRGIMIGENNWRNFCANERHDEQS